MGAWATEKELSPVGVLSWTNTPAITYDGEATSWAINQGGISGGKLGKYAGPYAIVKFDASSILDGMTLLSATLDFDITAGAYNSSINIAQMSDATFTPSTVTVDDFDATATQFQSGDWSTKNTTKHFSYDVKARVEANNVLAFAIYTNTGREQTLKDVKLVLNYSDAPVAKYNYSLKAVTSEALDIKTLAEGEEYETNDVTLYFPYMFYNEKTLYTTTTTPYSVTVDKDNANKTVTYAADGGDIVAYMEGEAAEANSGFDAAYSNGKTGHAAGNKIVTIATLPAGKYTATINFVANGNRSCVIRNTANTDVATNAIVSLPIDKNSSAGIYTSDEFTLTEETTIGFSGYTSDTKTNQSADIDYIFIEKTGEYVPVVTSYTVTIADGIVGGTVAADPTSANAGAEVTLTNTPAEGYEFVSYSVTGVKSNEAVLVTDGKFIMPADAVTVSAKFQKVAKTDIIYTAPEAVEGLVANGEAQALITAGTVEAGGEMQYSLDGENFSTAIPTATEAKKYTVYYRIVADDTHNDVAAQEIYVTIITAELDAAQKELVAAIEAAKAIDTEGKNGAEELAAAIKTAEGVIFADDVTVSAVNTAKENLAAAVAAFEEANKVAYDITVADDIVGGTVEVSSTSAKAGDEVTITATPAEGYELASVSVTGVTSNEAVIVTDGKFTMPADDVTVSAKFQKKVIYIDTDLTAKFNSLATTQWTGSSGQVGWAAPMVKTNTGLEVAAWERYNGSCDWTGDIMSSSVTGLVPGTYKIELYGAAAFTYGRGFGSTAFTGDFSKDKSDTYKENESIDENTGVTLYAETAEGKVSKEIPIWYADNFNTSGIATATLENVIVGESGEIKIGLSKTSTSTNWHVVQLKGVTAQVPADVLADAVEAAKSIAESDVPAKLYSEIQTAIETYDKEYSTADEYQTAINALNALVDKANGYVPLTAVLNEGDQYKANVPAEDPAIAAYDAAIADVKGAYDDAVVADIPAAVKVVEAALPAIAKAQTAPGSDMTRAIVNPTINGVSGWTCDRPKGGGGPELPAGGALEYWAGSANPRAEASFDYYQVIEGLTPGKYIVSAEMYNSLNGEEGAVFAPTSGVYASSGNDETATLVDVEGTTLIRYATEPVFVKDGTLRLGIKNTELPIAARWFVADNFTLTLVETIPTYEVDLAEPQNGAIEVSAAVAAEGDKVVVTATPNEGYELESVSVRGVKSDIAVQVVTDEVTGEMSFIMPNDAVVVSATFKEIAYPITYAIGMQNGTVEGPVESVAGEKVTLTVTPAEGYELENLTITCAESQNEINYDVVDYSFTMPKEGVYIIATFVQTTGIDAAPADKSIKADGKYFKNGKLIIIKNGKEYNAAGVAK